MAVLFKNNAHSTLASSINDSVTSVTVASGHGDARFPTVTGGDYFYATLIDGSNNLEVVKCTARSSDVLTIVRAQESTSARAFSTGDRIELRITAQGLADLNSQFGNLASSFAAGDVLYASNTTTLARLAKGAANQVLTMNSGATAPEWAATASTITHPTISSISPSTITNAATNVTITGTGYVTVPNVEAWSTGGAIINANSVSFTSATTIVANLTLPTDGTYFLRVENPDGLAVRSGSALLTVSDAPTWTTGSGSLGEVVAGGTMSFTIAATGDSTLAYSVASGSMPGGASLNSSTGAITGTESGASADTTYSFTARVTDAESQTADRAFTITVSVGMNNSAQFNIAAG